MKNTGKAQIMPAHIVRVFGSIVFAMVLVFAMAACGDDGDGWPPKTSGRLTITGLEAYEGQYVVAYYESYSDPKENLLAAAGLDETGNNIDGVLISNGKATLKVWAYGVKSYNKTENHLLSVRIYNNSPIYYYYDWPSQGRTAVKYAVYVEFTNGRGTAVWEDNSTTPPVVTSVTVSPATANVGKGGTRTFSATVTGTNNPAQTVTWSIVETGKKAGTTISSAGVLTVAEDETLETLTVKATSTADTAKSGTAAVTVTAPGTTTDESAWWTWMSTMEEAGYNARARISISPTADDTGCDVVITGAANTLYDNWATQVGADYSATAGKKYTVTWKWVANGKTFRNVDIRYAQQKDKLNDENYKLAERVTIPVTERTETYTFTMPDNCFTNFTFFVGEDTGSFRIRDFQVILIDTTPTVTSVTVSPATARVSKGGTRTLSATVTGTNSPAQTVTWSIVETDKKAATTITSAGVLTVAEDEALETLTVKATSTADTTKSGTAAVTITEAGTAYTTIADITAYLNGLTSNSTDTPEYLPVAINLGTMAAGSGWRQLLDAINTAGKYVDLDLSECTMTGTKFGHDNWRSSHSGMQRIVSITLPSSGVVSLEDNAFYRSANLKQIALPDTLTTVGESSFKETGLTSITLPSSLTNMQPMAFMDSKSLTSVIIPAGITLIKSRAFEGCTKLTTVTCLAEQPPTMENTFSGLFSGTHATLAIKVPADSVAAYKTASGWSSYASRIVAIDDN